jgi:hypothetical protein
MNISQIFKKQPVIANLVGDSIKSHVVFYFLARISERRVMNLEVQGRILLS